MVASKLVYDAAPTRISRPGGRPVPLTVLRSVSRALYCAPNEVCEVVDVSEVAQGPVVKVLLAHGADIHARSDVWSEVMAVPPHGHLDYNRAIPQGGDTALMFAARVGDLASAMLLVAAALSTPAHAQIPALLQVPQNAPTGDAVSLALGIGGTTSNTVTIAVQ